MQIETLNNLIVPLKAPLNAIKQNPIRFLIWVLVSIIIVLAAILIPIFMIRGFLPVS
jgi:hypothetical protein